MLPGILRDRVTIQERVQTQKATGVDEEWRDVETRWGRVVPLTGEARLRYSQLKSEVTHEVVLRGVVPLVVGTHRFVWLNRADTVLELTAPREDRDGRQRLTVAGVKEHNE